MRKDIGDLKEDDFDQYGFAHTLVSHIDDSIGMAIRFYAKKSEDVVELFDDQFFIGGFVDLNCPAKKEETNVFARMDIVETIKYLIKNFPDLTLDALDAMPTCLYENKQVCNDILSTVDMDKIQKDGLESIIRSKFDAIKKFKSKEDVSQFRILNEKHSDTAFNPKKEF